MQLVKGPKNQKRLPSFAQKKELEETKTVNLFKDDFEGVRDRLVFEMFYQTGIRSSELIGLIDSDVGLNQIKGGSSKFFAEALATCMPLSLIINARTA